MNYDNMVPADEVCIRYQVERQFVSSLYESGIIQIVRIKEIEYVPNDHLADLEKMMRLHKELDINLAGLEAVNHLLKKIDKLREDNVRLKNRLGLYE